MSDELKPCPFCGDGCYMHEDDGSFQPGCDLCNFVLESGSVGIGWYASYESAANAWNRRGGETG